MFCFADVIDFGPQEQDALNEVMRAGKPFERASMERLASVLDEKEIDMLQRIIEQELEAGLQDEVRVETQAGHGLQARDEDRVETQAGHGLQAQTRNTEQSENLYDVNLYKKYLEPEVEDVNEEKKREQELKEDIELIEEILHVLDQ